MNSTHTNTHLMPGNDKGCRDRAALNADTASSVFGVAMPVTVPGTNQALKCLKIISELTN